MVKTSLKIPDHLWEEAKVRAARERKDLADVVAEALEAHLKPRSEKKGRKTGASKKGGKP